MINKTETSQSHTCVTAIGGTEIRCVAIIGAGQMGNGIAQVFSMSGFTTLLFDSIPEVTKRGFSDIRIRLERLVEKDKLSASEREKALSNLSMIHSLSDCQNADLIVEAIIENTDIKSKLLRELDAICKPQTIFASNTSSISITKLAAATKRPEQVIGMHFMNPVPVMKLVEIIRGLQASDHTYQLIHDLVIRIGKTPVTARHDYPGFIVNRILVPMMNEAMFVLMEGIATVDEIDTAMKLGTNQPMGPLELADFVGLDTCLAITRIFHDELGDDKYRPCPLLVKYVEAGWVGKKSGRGFYRYEK